MTDQPTTPAPPKAEERWRFAISFGYLWLKGEREVCNWDLRAKNQSPPSLVDQATILRALNSHDPLLEALKKYGVHQCPHRLNEFYACDCGLADAITAAGASA